MEVNCPDCDTEFEVEEHDTCPECGFGPEKCNHPQPHRESKWVYDSGEGQQIERVYCGKCGRSATAF